MPGEPATVIDLDRETVKRGLADGSLVLVDVREPHEFAAGHIPGSVSLPLSMFDPAQLPDGQRVVSRAPPASARPGRRNSPRRPDATSASTTRVASRTGSRQASRSSSVRAALNA